MQNTMLGWNNRWPVPTILSALSTMKRSATLCVIQVDSPFPYPGFRNQNIFMAEPRDPDVCVIHCFRFIYSFFVGFLSHPPPLVLPFPLTLLPLLGLVFAPNPHLTAPITLSLPTSISTPNACYVLDGDCRVHCSTSGNGGQ